MKEHSASWVIGECKSKQQWDTTIRIHLLEWPNSGILKTSNADEDVEHKEFSYFTVENAKLYSHFGKQFGAFLQK